MVDSFKKLVPGINPTSGASTTEWFSVPVDHEYQGNIKVANVNTAGGGTTSFKMAVVSSSGVSPTKADWFTPWDTELTEGEYDEITIELTEGETVVVQPDDENVSFNFFGLDMDNS